MISIQIKCCKCGKIHQIEEEKVLSSNDDSYAAEIDCDCGEIIVFQAESWRRND